MKRIYLLLILCVCGCDSTSKTKENAGGPNDFLVDKDANVKTVALFNNLKEVAQEQTLFGHHHSLAYGYSWSGEKDRSDVKDVTGSFPAVYGWDFEYFGLLGTDPVLVEKSFQDQLRWSREGYNRGGVLTFAWHEIHPITKTNSWDKTPGAVASILPGGSEHEYYTRLLDEVARFFHALGEVPVIFRPYHEHNGDWFWWGKGFCTEEEYVQLWKFTVDYLRDTKNVHNVLYAFSPDRSRMNLENGRSEYFYGYPGDEYVDIIGIDDYRDFKLNDDRETAEEKAANFIKVLEMVTSIAEEKGKVAALTETGLEALPVADWWTETLLKGINANEQTRKIAYVQVWRNANFALENRDHFYAPHKGQLSAEDFIEFKEDESILFEDELPDMYK